MRKCNFIKTRSGTKTKSWGTPAILLKTAECVSPVIAHYKAVQSNPTVASLYKGMEGLAKSKALERSTTRLAPSGCSYSVPFITMVAAVNVQWLSSETQYKTSDCTETTGEEGLKLYVNNWLEMLRQGIIPPVFLIGCQCVIFSGVQLDCFFLYMAF